MTQRLLLVEDEELIGTMVRLNLEQEGFYVRWIRQGHAAIETAKSEAFDLILLDIMLPDANGIELLQTLRTNNIHSPVMMLTARAEVETKVEALNQGADDYLPKPFDMNELVARCRALIRRSQGERTLPSHSFIRLGEFWVNLETRESNTNEGVITLTEKEANALALLVRNADKTLSRADIMEEVWGMDNTATERTVDNMILRLRKLFEAKPNQPSRIKTVRNIGYRYES